MVDELSVDEGVLRVFSRNLYYREKFHYVLGFCLLALIFDAFLTLMLTYIIKHPVQPLYFPADKAGRLIQEVPLSEPNMSTRAVSEWTVRAVQAAYSYDFTNYHAQLQRAEKYFTAAGWSEYMKGLDRSNNMVALTERKLIVTARVVEPPRLMKEGLMSNGVMAWKFEMPVLLHYQMPPFNGKGDYDNPLIVTAVVQRQDVLSGNAGLGLVQLNAFTAS